MGDRCPRQSQRSGVSYATAAPDMARYGECPVSAIVAQDARGLGLVRKAASPISIPDRGFPRHLSPSWFPRLKTCGSSNVSQV